MNKLKNLENTFEKLNEEQLSEVTGSYSKYDWWSAFSNLVNGLVPLDH